MGLMRFKVVLLVLSLWMCIPIHFQVYAQAERLKFNHLSLEHGLSQNAVYTIIQDFRGFMWFGTEDGLNRYDGSRFISFKMDVTDPYSLGDNVVYCLFEDQSRTLWVGTRGGGLDRFNRDTGTFTHYRHNPNNINSLSENCVNVVYEPPQHPGELWIGTQANGVDKFEPRKERFTHYRHVPNNPFSPGSNKISQIYEDRSGKLWFATKGGGLNKFDRGTNRFIRFEFDPLDPNSTYFNNVFAICEDRTGMLWIGTDGGVRKFNPLTEQFTDYIFKPVTGNDPRNLSDNNVRVIHEDRRGIIWIGTLGGVNVLDPMTGKLIRSKANPLDPDGLSDNDVWSIYESRDGVLWIGTEGGGLNTLDLDGKPFIHYRRDIENPGSLNQNEIWSFCGSRQKPWITWIGTKGGGLNEFNEKTGHFTHYLHDPKNPRSISSNSIYAIYEGREGKFWIGTGNAGLSRFDPGNGSFTNYMHQPGNVNSLSNNCVWALGEDKHGNIWIGTDGGGLDCFDPVKKVFKHFIPKQGDPASISSFHIWSIHKDGTGTLWIGTADGLNRFKPETGTFTRYSSDANNPGSLGDNHILCIYTDHTGNLWIGTQGGGLNRFNREIGTFSRYTQKNGLPNNVIYGILEENVFGGGDDPYLWLSTNNGLSRFNPRTGAVKNYTSSDGLQSNEFNAGAFYKNKKGEMFFGGNNGFNVFDPRAIFDNHYIPPVVITRLEVLYREALPGKVIAGKSILKKSITETTEIKLSYRHDVLTFEFAALHYASPADNRFAYRLEGLEKDWNYSENRHFVTYSQLQPGDYVFHVKASNNDGIWNDEGISLKISIIPPPWKTWWFRIALVVFIGAMIYVLYRIRTQNIKSYEKELEKLVIERTQELKEKKDELEKLNGIKNKLLVELRIANKKLEKLSRIDGLTGIANRRSFDEALESEWKRCRRNKIHISMLMLDMDYFKLYNDTYGHQMGDMCLKSIGVILSFHISRPGDMAARYGGEEFAAILVDTDLEGARTKAEDIRKRVVTLGIPHGASKAADVMTVSIGVAAAIPTDEDGYNELVKAADKALYKAKNSGRNCVCIPDTNE